MRVAPRDVGSLVHVIKRGARGMPIVRDEHDKRHFVESLFYFNDSFIDPNLGQALKSCKPFQRPEHWPERDPLVNILAWTLMPNHFHLLLEEIREDGIAKFMQRLCGSMSMTFNAKYAESGSIFQGSYKSRTIEDDLYLQYLLYYIQVKNVLELYPGGLTKAAARFDDAWEWANRYRFSSFSSYATGAVSPVIETGRLSELTPDASLNKSEAREMIILNMQSHDEKYSDVALELW